MVRGRLLLGVLAVAGLLTGCGSDPSPTASAPPTSSAASATSAESASSPPPTSSASAAPPSTAAPVSPPAAGSATTVPPPPAAAAAPVIVIDPGHSPTITSTDPATGLDDSTYENEPEMADVWAVSLLVQQRLVADGYTVLLTKKSVDDRVSLGARAAIANTAHAALAISVHDQAGADGGIPFASGNNIVYTQTVGKYRETPAGSKVVFTDAAVAATSQRDGAIFQAQRAAAEGHTVRVQGDTGYDQGSRGHPGGNMWMVQLLSTVPWIYNEAGGNSAGTVGLDPADRQRYADGLVAGVEACVPLG